MAASIAGTTDTEPDPPHRTIEQEPAAQDHSPRTAFPRWAWVGVPLLALLAYATVLRIGFLADDYVLYFQSHAGFNPAILLPERGWTFYRPVTTLILWRAGAQAWGDNALPYHLVGLLVHAATALALGVWLALVTGRRWLGWLAGALFAVFPAHLEAVGWLAAQWDAWAALFGILSLIAFTSWWRYTKRGAWLLAASVTLYALGLFSKESLLTWIPMYALSAWLVSGSMDRATWRRLALALVPFVAVLALNLGLRLLTWGNIGGYAGTQVSYGDFFWDGLIYCVRALLSPVNATILGAPTVEVVGLLSSVLIIVGLVLFGHGQRRLLLLAGGWLLLTLAPVVNLAVNAGDLQNNRFLYLPAAGYCIVLAVLISEAVMAVSPRWSALSIGAVALLLALGIGATWLQLRPWHTTTVQTEELGEELRKLVPPDTRANELVFYTENVPDTYKGAYLLRIGLDGLRFMTSGDEVQVSNTRRAKDAPLTTDGRDAFAMRFNYDMSTNRYHIDYASGITSETEPPVGEALGVNPQVWDFRECASDALQSWHATGAKPSCRQGEGLVLAQSGPDAQITGPAMSLDTRAEGVRFVRLRVAVRYATPVPQEKPPTSQWFWHGPGQEWSEERTSSMPLKDDGKTHVYWTYLPVSQTGDILVGLRFDPANAPVDATVPWIAADLIG